MKSIETVGILGLGKMGCPIAAHLVAKGFKVVGYDPLEEARNRAVALGARGAASAREAARASDLVIIVVGFDSEVEEVLFGREGVLEGARPGLIVALGSTVAPRYSTRLAVRLAEKNLVLLDIPLARGEAAAAAGKLLVYGAGDPAAFELCRPVFGALASDLFHLGPAGAGSRGVDAVRQARLLWRSFPQTARSGARGSAANWFRIGGDMGTYSNLSWQLLVQFLLVLFLTVAVSGLAVGVGLIASSPKIVGYFHILNRWVSTRHVLSPVQCPLDTGRVRHRHH